MGAVYCEMSIPAAKPQAAIKTEFEEMQAEDRYHNGHSYSGGWGQASGLTFLPRQTFASVEAAGAWLQDNAAKWGPALAVRAKRADGTEVWVIGAWCAE
jgi:hypothetical protein